MGKYLKKFQNHSAYQSAKSGFILPNVSLCIAEDDVHYNPIAPTPQHDFVEIGGIKWATMNIGASQPSDYGLYFAWGDTQGYTTDQVGSGSGQKAFEWADYKYSDNGSSSVMTKYNSTDGKTVLDASDDAVTAAWGGNWRMPTTAEFQALVTATTSAWTSSYEGSGVSGLVLTSKEDSSKKLFFPAAGSCSGGSVGGVGSRGSYWSSLPNPSLGVEYGMTLSFNSRLVYTANGERKDGFPVRGVIGE